MFYEIIGKIILSRTLNAISNLIMSKLKFTSKYYIGYVNTSKSGANCYFTIFIDSQGHDIRVVVRMISNSL